MELLGDMGKMEAPSVSLEIVLISTQDRCLNCVKRAIGLKIILGAPNGTPR
jgi:hypothetical protein